MGGEQVRAPLPVAPWRTRRLAFPSAAVPAGAPAPLRPRVSRRATTRGLHRAAARVPNRPKAVLLQVPGPATRRTRTPQPLGIQSRLLQPPRRPKRAAHLGPTGRDSEHRHPLEPVSTSLPAPPREAFASFELEHAEGRAARACTAHRARRAPGARGRVMPRAEPQTGPIDVCRLAPFLSQVVDRAEGIPNMLGIGGMRVTERPRLHPSC